MLQSSRVANIAALLLSTLGPAAVHAIGPTGGEYNDGEMLLEKRVIGTTKQLLFDDWIVQQLTNARRATTTLHPTLVVQADAPWEAGYTVEASGGVVKEQNGTVRLWYTMTKASASEGVTAVAVSDDDGATFVKPLLGLRPGDNGSTANNFLVGNSMAEGTQNVWLDQHTTERSERYVGQHEDALSGEIVLTVSADGLTWREKSRWNFQGNADSRAAIFFDSWIERYVLITRNWYFLPTPSEWRRPCPPGVVRSNCSQPPAWDQPSFRRVRRLEARNLTSYSIAEPQFIELELGSCATSMGLPRDGSAEWRQMWLGPGLNKPAGCWGSPYLDECIAINGCSDGVGAPVGLRMPRGPSDAGTPGHECHGRTIEWALNGSSFISAQTGLCLEAKATLLEAGRTWGVAQARCDPDNPRQAWVLNTSSMQLQLLQTQLSVHGDGTSSASPECLALQIPDIKGHNGHADRNLGVYGLPAGDETPTNSIDTCWPWDNQTTVLEADAVDNSTFGVLSCLAYGIELDSLFHQMLHPERSLKISMCDMCATVNLSPDFNRGNGAPIDYYGAVIWPQPRVGSESSGGRVYIMMPMRFAHHSLPCDGPGGSQCLPATFDVPVLASRDGVNFTYVADDRGALVEPAASGGWNSNGLTYVLGTPHLTQRGDEMVLYFWGTNANHNGVLDPGAEGGKKISGIASARMRLDGFVHVEPKEPDLPAVLITKPIIFDGSVLLVNADAGGAGQIVAVLVPVTDLSRNAGSRRNASRPAPVRSEPFCGNAINGTIQWSASGNPLARLAGTLVHLHFEIYRAKLYSFQFAETHVMT